MNTDNKALANEKNLTLLGLDDIEDTTLKVKRLFQRADVVAGPQRWLKDLKDFQGETLPLTGKLDLWLADINSLSRSKKVLVLASGDPNFYGLARKLLTFVPGDRVTIIPSTTTVQKAFARINTTWAGALVESLHGRDAFRNLYNALYRAGGHMLPGFLALYTDPQNTPGLIAKKLLERDQDAWEMIVFEDLDQETEKITTLSLNEAATRNFSPLNLTVLKRTREIAPVLIGAPEQAYEHEAGMITKSEVRAVALSLLELKGTETLWDIGSGSGSVSIEAAALLSYGQIVAVEKNPERLLQARANRKKYACAQVDFREGEVLDLIDSLPKPDRIFVGGGGSDLSLILEEGKRRLVTGGIIVASVISLASLTEAAKALTGPNGPPSVVQLSAARSQALAGSFYFKPQNQIYLVKGSF
ncbi:MAG: precorrin-6y C5,15-methyltransferase (decarboxylating) subunit CbiE [Deltaproteobacteria bacterium]|nr:precorrin-6y C5,15-methyltransferase (decarboxylating) subunit CbiE [Deltaproteobacteria bacterium]